MPEIPDYIVVGSGPSGAQAAQTLIEAGFSVNMLDVGFSNTKYEDLLPDEDFASIRQLEKDQHRYLLGDHYESVQWGKVQTGAQLTPARRHLVKMVDTLTPLLSATFKPMESFAYGGLGAAWGIGCCVFSDAELEKAGLDVAQMYEGYRTVARRIGITGSTDDTQAYTLSRLQDFQNEYAIDENSKSLLEKYQQKKRLLNKNGFFMGKPSIALLTEDRDGRKATSYKDMDFYSDKHKSAYRPWITVEELKKNPNFTYTNNNLVLKFKERDETVEVSTIDITDKTRNTFSCKKLIIAGGVMGTARIVLRSLGKYNTKIPLLCNPYRYAPCIQWSRLGKVDQKERNSFVQLVMFHDADGKNENVAMASLYSYRSLMLFRLIKEVPLNIRAAGKLMRYLSPAITILGIHLPDNPDDKKYLQLAKSDNGYSGDVLKAEYSLSKDETAAIKSRLKKFTSSMATLNCTLLKMINPGHGSSIHYAGSLPFSDEEKRLTLQKNGRLSTTSNVYVADSSGFKYLPAKGITFSLMANAHNVAVNSINDQPHAR